jgi:hypothetical protein
VSDTYVQALLAERVGYLATGKKDRVAAVDAELARFGVAVETARAVPPAETADEPKRPRRRT